MRIPDAYFNGGLGQRLAPVVKPVMIDGSGTAAVAQAGQQLGNTLLQTGLDANEMQGRIDMQAAHERRNEVEKLVREQEQYMKEQEHELKRQDLERQSATAKRQYLDFTPQLFAIQDQISNDPDVPPEDYPKTFRERAQKLADEKLYPAFNEHQKNQIEPLVMGHINESSQQMFKMGQAEINDNTWSEEIASLATLKNDPTRSAAQKIAIIKDENFFTGTGRDAAEIEKTRQQAIQEVIGEDAAHQFNSLKPDTKAKDPIQASLRMLEQFRTQITAQDANGQFTYQPDWDKKQREEYVSMAIAKKQALEAQAAQIQREGKAAAMQEATNLMMEYKDKVRTGWVPVSAADYRFQQQVKHAASMSPSLARQYDENTSYTTDLGKRLTMRKADPLGVAAAERGLTIKPLNIMDVATLPQQLTERIKVARGLGINAVFKGEEVKAVSDYLQTLSPKDQVKWMAALTKPLGPAITAATFNSAAEQVKIDKPDQAIMFKLYGSGKPAEAQLYAEGRAYLTGEKKDVLKDKFTAVQQQAGERIDKQLGEALSSYPDRKNALKEAIVTTYLGEAHRRNLPLDSLDKKLLADVTKRVAGETSLTGSFGSRKTTIIPDSMTPDQFSNNIKAITPADIRKRGGVEGMTDEEAAKLIKNNAWHEGDGGYTFTKNGNVLYGKDGRRFTFNFNDGVGTQPPAPSRPVTNRAEKRPEQPSRPSLEPVKDLSPIEILKQQESARHENAVKKMESARTVQATKDPNYKYNSASNDDYVDAIDSNGNRYRAAKSKTELRNGIVYIKEAR